MGNGSISQRAPMGLTTLDPLKRRLPSHRNQARTDCGMVLEDLEAWVLLRDRVKRQEENSAELFNSLSFPRTFDYLLSV